jgi:hypothetical protein
VGEGCSYSAIAVATGMVPARRRNIRRGAHAVRITLACKRFTQRFTQYE